MKSVTITKHEDGKADLTGDMNVGEIIKYCVVTIITLLRAKAPNKQEQIGVLDNVMESLQLYKDSLNDKPDPERRSKDKQDRTSVHRARNHRVTVQLGIDPENQMNSCYFSAIVNKIGLNEYEGIVTLPHEIGLQYSHKQKAFIGVAEDHFSEMGIESLLKNLSFPELEKYPVGAFIEMAGTFEVTFFETQNYHGEIDDPEYDVKDFCHQQIPDPENQ